MRDKFGMNQEGKQEGGRKKAEKLTENEGRVNVDAREGQKDRMEKKGRAEKQARKLKDWREEERRQEGRAEVGKDGCEKEGKSMQTIGELEEADGRYR